MKKNFSKRRETPVAEKKRPKRLENACRALQREAAEDFAAFKVAQAAASSHSAASANALSWSVDSEKPSFEDILPSSNVSITKEALIQYKKVSEKGWFNVERAAFLIFL